MPDGDFGKLHEITPSGHWSSYRPDRHEEDGFPDIAYLEETCYSVADHDVVHVPRGHHPCCVPHGCELCCLNVMADPLHKCRYKNHPAHSRIYEIDSRPVPDFARARTVVERISDGDYSERRG